MMEDLGLNLRRAAALQLELADTSPCGYQRLALSVLKYAFVDARKGKKPTIAWFRDKREAMRVWCEILDLDPDLVSERVMAAIEDGRAMKYKRGDV
jgi:hypothetical protein